MFKPILLEFHNEKDMKVLFLHITIYLHHKEFIMWCEFRMFTCVLTECYSFDLHPTAVVSGSQRSWLSGRAQNSQAVDQSSRLKQL